MRPLTSRQREVFCCICDLIREQQYPPSRRAIAARMGFHSLNSVERYLRALSRKGLLKVAGEGLGRAIRVTAPGCAYCGTVEIPEAALLPRARRELA